MSATFAIVIRIFLLFIVRAKDFLIRLLYLGLCRGLLLWCPVWRMCWPEGWQYISFRSMDTNYSTVYIGRPSYSINTHRAIILHERLFDADFTWFKCSDNCFSMWFKFLTRYTQRTYIKTKFYYIKTPSMSSLNNRNGLIWIKQLYNLRISETEVVIITKITESWSNNLLVLFCSLLLQICFKTTCIVSKKKKKKTTLLKVAIVGSSPQKVLYKKNNNKKI